MEAFLRTLQDVKRVSLECNLVKVGNFQSDARGLGPEPDLQNLHDPTKYVTLNFSELTWADRLFPG